MTVIATDRRSRRRRLRIRAYLGVTAAWAASIAVGAIVVTPPWLHAVALFVHLASLIVGLGAVLMIEWHGLLWISRWSSVREVRQADQTLILPIWLGIAGLYVSGALLHPNLQSPPTLVKLGAVLVLSLNGVALTRLTEQMARFPSRVPFRRLPPRVRAEYISSAIVSQLAWWSAVVIGMLNVGHR